MDDQKLRLLVINAKLPKLEDAPIYEKCFKLWHGVWNSTLLELNGRGLPHSDGFTKKDFFFAIIENSNPIGLIFFERLNLRLMPHLQDSWFSPWPQSLLENLSLKYHDALIPSWLTVHPERRRSKGSEGSHPLAPNNNESSRTPLSLILSEMICLELLNSGLDIAFGTPRKDRRVHELVARAGAKPLVTDVVFNNVLIDLVGFLPENLSMSQFSEISLELWKEREDYRTREEERPKQLPITPTPLADQLSTVIAELQPNP